MLPLFAHTTWRLTFSAAQFHSFLETLEKSGEEAFAITEVSADRQHFPTFLTSFSVRSRAARKRHSRKRATINAEKN